MKTGTQIALFAGVLLACGAYAGYYTASPELKRALERGADTKVVFHIVDDEGNPVEGAYIDAVFYLNGRERDMYKHTDKTGCAEFRNKSVGEVIYKVTKDGFYKTKGTILLREFSRQDELIKDGRWQPYGATNTFTLKPIKNPTKMVVLTPKSFERMPVPETNKWIGFDLERQDWTKPLGSGEEIDFEARLTFVGKRDVDYRMATLELRAVRPFDGMYFRQKDQFSEYVSDYRADTNRTFLSHVKFERERDLETGMWRSDRLGDDAYMVFRTRSEVDGDGNFKGANYSKLYGKIIFGQSKDGGGIMDMKYFYNPVFNDTNLESEWEYHYSSEYIRLRDGRR